VFLAPVVLSACYASHGLPEARDAGVRPDGGSDAGPDAAATIDASCEDGLTCDDSNACTFDDRCRAGVCIGRALGCDSPPGACFASSGRCVEGECVYDFDDGSSCDDGDACTADDRCEGGWCAGTLVACATPPVAECVDDTTLRRFSVTGTCTAGACQYVPAERPCPDGCVDGECRCVPHPWSTTTVVGRPPNLGGVGPDAIAVDDAGTVHVAHMLQPDEAPFEQSVAYAQRAPGGAWTLEPVGPTMSPPVLRLDGRGAPHLLYRRRASPTEHIAIHAVRSATGVWRTDDVSLPAPRPIFAPREPVAFDVDADGTLHVLFRSVGTPGYARAAATGGWEVIEDRPDLDDWQPRALAVEDTGSVHMLFVADSRIPGDPSRHALRYAQRDPGGSWTTQDIDVGAESIYDVRLGVRAGAVHVLYTGAASRLEHATRLSAGGAWSVESVDAVGTIRSLGGMSIDAMGDVHTTYSVSDARVEPRIGYARRSPSGTWTLDPVPFVPFVPDAGALASPGALSVDDDGGVHVVFGQPLELLDYAYQRRCP
jgi:hypothetical protein